MTRRRILHLLVVLGPDWLHPKGLCDIWGTKGELREVAMAENKIKLMGI